MKTEHLFVFHRLLAYNYVIVIHNVRCSNNVEIQGEDRQIGADAGLNCPFPRDLRRELKQIYRVKKYTSEHHYNGYLEKTLDPLDPRL